jgi:hypothetical protein
VTAQFPGLVARQELINFCRARVAEMQKESETYLTALNKAGDKISFDDAAALNDAYYANIGEQRAYRKICDWATDNCESGTEYLDSDELQKMINQKEADDYYGSSSR